MERKRRSGANTRPMHVTYKWTLKLDVKVRKWQKSENYGFLPRSPPKKTYLYPSIYIFLIKKKSGKIFFYGLQGGGKRVEAKKTA